MLAGPHLQSRFGSYLAPTSSDLLRASVAADVRDALGLRGDPITSLRSPTASQTLAPLLPQKDYERAAQALLSRKVGQANRTVALNSAPMSASRSRAKQQAGVSVLRAGVRPRFSVADFTAAAGRAGARQVASSSQSFEAFTRSVKRTGSQLRRAKSPSGADDPGARVSSMLALKEEVTRSQLLRLQQQIERERQALLHTPLDAYSTSMVTPRGSPRAAAPADRAAAPKPPWGAVLQPPAGGGAAANAAAGGAGGGGMFVLPSDSPPRPGGPEEGDANPAQDGAEGRPGGLEDGDGKAAAAAGAGEEENLTPVQRRRRRMERMKAQGKAGKKPGDGEKPQGKGAAKEAGKEAGGEGAPGGELEEVRGELKKVTALCERQKAAIEGLKKDWRAAKEEGATLKQELDAKSKGLDDRIQEVKAECEAVVANMGSTLAFVQDQLEAEKHKASQASLSLQTLTRELGKAQGFIKKHCAQFVSEQDLFGALQGHEDEVAEYVLQLHAGGPPAAPEQEDLPTAAEGSRRSPVPPGAQAAYWNSFHQSAGQSVSPGKPQSPARAGLLPPVSGPGGQPEVFREMFRAAMEMKSINNLVGRLASGEALDAREVLRQDAAAIDAKVAQPANFSVEGEKSLNVLRTEIAKCQGVLRQHLASGLVGDQAAEGCAVQ